MAFLKLYNYKKQNLAVSLFCIFGKNKLIIMKKFLFITTLLIGANLFAQDWEYVTSGEDNNKFYYKPNTDDTAWIKEVSEKLVNYDTDKGKNKKTIDGYRVTLYKFDCSKRQIGGIQIITYSKLGKILKTYTLPEYLVQMNYVVPESIGESILNSFCKETY